MELDFGYIYGQTPLEEEEKDGLLIPTIANCGELDEFEQQNIEDAIQWIFMRTFKTEAIFTEAFVRTVHKRMYGNVWAWAGDFRKTDKNIGIDKWQIPVALRTLLDDAVYWTAHQTFPPDEIAVRFKHRLVSIHCFPNGNGRQSRLMADIIIEKVFKQPVFSWGAADLVKKGDARTAYLQALKAADTGEIEPLLVFARS